ncbi:MAG: right-handed parallel beta-helix repeat-containing protein [Anaerolineae bacterium]|nr:right-handed parallel beta-helix repeat-containing protein [Anaerolineae bacterium]
MKLVGFILLLLMPVQSGQVLHVPDPYPTITAALEASSPGAIIQIEAGEYAESLVIHKPVTLIGRGIVVISGQSDRPSIIVEDTGGVLLDGLTIHGGEHGILVYRSRDVTIQNSNIIESRLVGIKVRQASAEIINNMITDAQPPYGRGIHITNGMEWPESNIIHNTVIGSADHGIMTNMAKVNVRANTIIGSGRAGIAITEMTHGLVANNVVNSSGENALYISDWSRVIACQNRLMNTLPPTIQGERYGNGVTVDYHARVQLQGNLVMDNARNGVSILASSIVDLHANRFVDNVLESVWVDASSQSGEAPPIFCREPDWGMQLWRGT